MNHTEQVSPTPGERRSQRLRRWAAIAEGSEGPFGLHGRHWLAANTLFYMGMGVNLFITIPQNHPGAGATNFVVGFFDSVVWGIAHGGLLYQQDLYSLLMALGVSQGTLRWVGLFGAMAAGMALALYGVFEAVDGVALKQAVDAWAGAEASEKAARFASASAVRWVEWGAGSYHSYLLGLALVLLALVIVWTARVPRLLGSLMGVSGLAYLGQGWVIGNEGYSSTVVVLTIAGVILLAAWSIWLLIFAWRGKASVPAATRARGTNTSI